MKRLKHKALGAALLLLATSSAHAQTMPPPKKAPRVPVKSEQIAEERSLPASRVLEGKATVLDAERLKIGGYEVRLFGVVPPQTSASHGPQARAVIDALAAGITSCRIKDRDREGRLLAHCSNEDKADFGIELLRRGLAVTARGSLEASDFASPYLAAEKAAQDARLGLWSNQTTGAASEKSIREAAGKLSAAKAELTRLKEEEAEAKAQIEIMAKAAAEAAENAARAREQAAETAQNTIPAAEETGSTAVGLSSGQTDEGAAYLSAFVPQPAAQEETGNQLPLAAQTTTATEVNAMPEIGFVERYQLLITGLLFLMATLAVVGGVTRYKLRQKQDDLRAIAAALRGELMAARSICQARLAKIAHEGDERTTRWPRLRSTVFQAYVDRLGHLGADLSRQIASIYGQASDYASYYNTGDERSEGASKRQALASLVSHIEEITPRLATIEKHGRTQPPRLGALLPRLAALPRALAAPAQQAPQHQPAKPLSYTQGTKSVEPRPPASQSSQPQPPTDGPGSPRPFPRLPAQETRAERKPLPTGMASQLTEAKTEVMEMADQTTARASAKQPQKTTETPAETATKPTQKPPQKTIQPPPERRAEGGQKRARPPLAQRAIVKELPGKSDGFVNFAAPIFDRLSKIRAKVVTGPIASPPPRRATSDTSDFSIPDYTNLTEEEMEALLYAEEEFFARLATKSSVRRKG